MLAFKFLQSLWKERGLRFHAACYFAYIAFGGFCFFLIEGGQERNDINAFMDARATFLKENPCVSEESLNVFLMAITPGGGKGLIDTNGTSTPTWTYSQSVLFAVSLATTVGYGQVAPATAIGKITCMIYAFIGIRLSNAFVQSCVRYLMRFSRKFRRFLYYLADNSMAPLMVNIIHQVAVTVTVVLTFFVLPALVFYHMEKGWTYLDALYFCFITLRTIGLGDYVPSQSPEQPYASVYRIGIAAYIISGITATNFLSTHVAEFRNNAMDDDEGQDTESTPLLVKKYMSYESIV